MQSVNTPDQIAANQAAIEFLSKQPSFFTDHFIDISSSVRKFHINPAFQHNADLERQVPGWPDRPDPHNICLFSVPYNTTGVLKENMTPSRAEEQQRKKDLKSREMGKIHRLFATNSSDAQPIIVDRSVHTGMGRGVSSVYFPDVKTRADVPPKDNVMLRPGMIGFFDPETGYY